MKTKHIICVFLFTGLLLSCGSTKTALNPDDKLVGDWSLIAESTSQGDVLITMTITKNEAGMFAGSFKSMMGEFAIDEFKGETLGPGQSYVTNGKRKAE